MGGSVSLRALAPDEVRIVELLVLRHLYDGDLLDWPLPDDHPDRPLFDALEGKGWIARWDRIWPLRDRYRITEAGIAELERHYAVDRVAPVLERWRATGLSAPKRRRWLRDQGIDEPELACALHDPTTHWETFRYEPGAWLRWLRESGEAAIVAPEPEPRRRRVVDDLDRAGHVLGGGDAVWPAGDVS